jgi:signal transduction histidine kinase
VALLPVYPTVDVTLPIRLSPSRTAKAGEGVPRGIRVRFHSPGIAGEVRTLVNVTLVLAALDVAMLVLFGGLLLDRSVLSPVRRLAAVSEKIASGDYAVRAEGVEGNELGQLAAAFNRMVDAILAAQERLRRSEQETFRSDKLATVGRLAAGVAHEVGNPLMAIRGYAEHVRRNRPSPEETGDCQGKIVAETQRIENIVRGLLSVASPGGEGTGSTDVDAMLRETLEMLSYRNLFRNVEIRREGGVTEPAEIASERLRQVVLNLILNAVDAMNGEGTLTVRTRIADPWIPRYLARHRRRATDPPDLDPSHLRKAAGRDRRGVEISVSDSGPGIPAGDLPLVFDPFFTTKEPGMGTGLGLSVSRTIVEAAGGEIWAESAEGAGATFRVVLPVKPKGEGT